MAIKVLITGATGMLGRSLMRHLNDLRGYECIGVGYSRAEPPLKKLDLLNRTETSQLIDDVKPDIVVHCAAERSPGKAASDPERTKALNVNTSLFLAEECARVNAKLIYMSTDYVFDGGVKSGVKSPYFPDSQTMPLSFYGETKLAGEEAVLSISGANAIVVRVPILYAMDCECLAESASLIVAKSLLDKDTPFNEIDDWQIRYFTSVDDVSAILRYAIDASQRPKNPIGGIVLHVSPTEPHTKFELVQMMMDITGADGSHLTSNPNPPDDGLERPQKTELNCDETWKVLKMEPYKFIPLYDGVKKALIPFKDSFPQMEKSNSAFCCLLRAK
eukprot:35072_1